MSALHAADALLPGGWARDVRVAWDAAGTLIAVTPGVPPQAGDARAAGPLVPGLPNLHSHAFQRAFAGLTEHRGAAAEDSFWTWRDLMYRFALAVGPDPLEAIATHLYVEMLQAGYTAVCEFHYLHHDPAGAPYAEPAEMALRLVRAARTAGIGLTLLPVLYEHAGFGNQPARPDQRRFVNGPDALLRIAQRCAAEGVRVGVAPHSLRAVSAASLQAVVDGIGPEAPVHIHIAEQTAEVEECLAWSGARPVRWLLDHAPVDTRWCLVHATHLDGAEVEALARSGAVAGLCPTTEANLGDGVFPLARYLAAGGHCGVGSDSHATVDAAAELALLEYGQRLTLRRRNVAASAAQPSVAATLWAAAAAGGAQAAGLGAGGLTVGARADLVVLDASGPLAELEATHVLDGAVFARNARPAVRDVWVGGARRIDAGHHPAAEAACAAFTATRRALLDATR